MISPKDCYLWKKRVSPLFKLHSCKLHNFYTSAHSRLGVLFPAPPTVVQDRIKLLSDKAYELLSSQLDQPDQSDIDFKVFNNHIHSGVLATKFLSHSKYFGLLCKITMY